MMITQKEIDNAQLIPGEFISVHIDLPLSVTDITFNCQFVSAKDDQFKIKVFRTVNYGAKIQYDDAGRKLFNNNVPMEMDSNVQTFSYCQVIWVRRNAQLPRVKGKLIGCDVLILGRDNGVIAGTIYSIAAPVSDKFMADKTQDILDIITRLPEPVPLPVILETDEPSIFLRLKNGKNIFKRALAIESLTVDVKDKVNQQLMPNPHSLQDIDDFIAQQEAMNDNVLSQMPGMEERGCLHILLRDIEQLYVVPESK